MRIIGKTKSEIEADAINDSLKLEIALLLEYLKSVDWYATRFVMEGTSIPEEIKLKCQEARNKISSNRQQLGITPIEENNSPIIFADPNESIV
jgi:hypothetical protein